MPMMRKAAAAHRLGGPLTIEEVPIVEIHPLESERLKQGRVHGRVVATISWHSV